MAFRGELCEMDENIVNEKTVENGSQAVQQNQRLERAKRRRNGERPAFDPKNPRKGRPPGKLPPLCKEEQDYRNKMYMRERRRKERLAKLCAQQLPLPTKPAQFAELPRPTWQLQPAVQFWPEDIDLDNIVPTLQAEHLPCSKVLMSVLILDLDDIDREELNCYLG